MSIPRKCLQGFPGVSFVLAERAALERSAALPRRSFYLHLYDNWRAQEETGEFLFTPPVQVLHAFDAALDEVFTEGCERRHRRYAACYAALRTGMQALGFRCLLPEEWHSGLLTAYHEPDHPAWRFDAMHDDLYALGVTVYPGKISEARTFRLANIGDLCPDDMRVAVGYLADHMAARRIFL